jgi:hypothetical protein
MVSAPAGWFISLGDEQQVVSRTSNQQQQLGNGVARERNLRGNLVVTK